MVKERRDENKRARHPTASEPNDAPSSSPRLVWVNGHDTDSSRSDEGDASRAHQDVQHHHR